MTLIDVRIKKNIKIGMLVDIIAEEDKESGKLSRGYVQKILSQANHSKGIKVQLTDGKIGRIQRVITKDELRLENFKFYNRFFFLPVLYTIWDKKEGHFLVILHRNPNNDRIERTAFLFDSLEEAKKMIKGTPYDHEDYPIRTIHRKKTLAELLTPLQIDFIRINGSRKISFERLKEWEYYFKHMK